MLYSKKNKKNISYLNDRVKKLFKTNLSLIFKIIYGQHVSRHSKLHLSLEVERIRSFSFTNGSAKQLCLTLQCWRVRFLEPVSTKDWPFVSCLKNNFYFQSGLYYLSFVYFSHSIVFFLHKFYSDKGIEKSLTTAYNIPFCTDFLFRWTLLPFGWDISYFFYFFTTHKIWFRWVDSYILMLNLRS